MEQVIVVSAFACDPRLPSEPTIGWNFVNAISDAAEDLDNIRVLAFMNARSAEISSQMWEGDLRTRFVGVDLPKLLGFLKDSRLTRLEYLVWTFQVRRHLRRLSTTSKILFAHHVTFASELLPTPITSLGKETYKVWGPIGSSGNPNVYKITPRIGHWRFNFMVQTLRNIASTLMASLNSRNADLVLTTSRELSDLLKSRGVQTQVFPNTILDDALIKELKSIPPAVKLAKRKTILCVGNLVYLKRFELAIVALTDPLLQNTDLIIIGKPAEGKKNYLISIAEKLGVDSRVQFLGQVPRATVLAFMENADVLFHPSAREGGSGVVGEATTVGIPVVCFSGTGSAVVLRSASTSGIELETSTLPSPAKMASALFEAMKMPRKKTQQWTYARYVELASKLIADANTSAPARKDEPPN